MSENDVKKKRYAESALALVVVLAVAAGAAWFTRGIWGHWMHGDMTEMSAAAGHEGHDAPRVIYTCPMHPEVVRDQPGNCPICGMTLVKKEVAPDTSHEGHDAHGDMKMSDTEPKAQSTIYHCPTCPDSETHEKGVCPTCGKELVVESGGHKMAAMKPEPNVEYTCQMCPQVISDKPGTCPDCGMALVEKKPEQHSTIYFCPMCPGSESYEPGACTTCGMKLMEKEPGAPGHSDMRHEGHEDMKGMEPSGDMSGMEMKTGGGGGEEEVVYTCPMHPQIIRDQPGNCPICGMTLVKKTVKPGGGMEGHAGHSGHDAEPLPEGVRRVSLDPREVAIANVRTDVVGYTDFSRDVSTVGRVEYNEESIEAVSAWFPGRIESIRVKYVGENVRKGQTVMSVYSPELLASQKELIIARDTVREMAGKGYGDIQSHAADMLVAARGRLIRWGLGEAEVASIETTGEFMETVTVASPVSGTVVVLGVREGGYVKEGTELFKVADLGSVWMNAEVYEYEFSKASMGAKVVVTAEAYPSMTFEGRVSFISPDVDMQSRTVGVRVTLPNPGGLLKPGMFVDARILSNPRRALTVPATAVLYTGKRDIVWVQVDKGTYESREVRLGERSEGYYEVVAGLAEGDRVVTQGGFLIDSEAELNSSVTGGGHVH